MLRKFIHPILIFPICFFINSQKALLSETNNNIEEVIKEKESEIFLNYSEIVDLTLKNNQDFFLEN